MGVTDIPIVFKQSSSFFGSCQGTEELIVRIGGMQEQLLPMKDWWIVSCTEVGEDCLASNEVHTDGIFKLGVSDRIEVGITQES